MAVNKEALVVDLWNPDGEEGGWSPHFSRYFNDWELEEVPLFFARHSTKESSLVKRMGCL